MRLLLWFTFAFPLALSAATTSTLHTPIQAPEGIVVGATNVVDALAGKQASIGFAPAQRDETPLNLSGTTVDLSVTNRAFSKAISAPTTLTIANVPDGACFSVVITNVTGSATLAWSGVDFWTTSQSSTAPTLDAVAGAVNVYTIWKIGGRVVGTVDQQGIVTESNLSLSDVTTRNADTTKHGFMPKLSGDATKALTGAGTEVTFAGANAAIGSIGITIDGGGSAITTGVKGDIYIPYACTINSVTLLADQSGSAVVDIWKDSYANYPPTVGDTITASAKPTISAAVKGQDTTLTGWTTAVAAGSTLRFNVDSASSITRLTLVLKVTK